MTSVTTSAMAFPRAELGLPIVFHFKRGPDSPNDAELYPDGNSQRLASPVILKALAVGDGTKAVPMLLRLLTPPLQGARLKASGVPVPPVIGTQEIRRPDLATYNNSPLKGRSTEGSALEGFVKFAESKGFREINACRTI